MSLVLIKQFLKNPATTGTVWPSSPSLCKAMIADIDIDRADTVVELGPGTGVITKEILNTIQQQTNFFAIELNQDLCNKLKQKMPEVKVFQDSASNLGNILKQEGLDHVDCVISGLPWASLPDRVQEDILSAVLEYLPEGGFFTTFAYLQGMLLPAARKFRARLNQHFSSVRKSRIVWDNMPPAFVYICRK